MESSRNESSASSGVEFRCYEKAVLKKIKRRVLVGDQVLVESIDWVERTYLSERARFWILLWQMLIILWCFFSLDQPKLEPFMLTRFFVEAESTGLPLTIALNKAELVDKEARHSFHHLFEHFFTPFPFYKIYKKCITITTPIPEAMLLTFVVILKSHFQNRRI